MREERYQWHPALLRFVVPETPNILRIRYRKRWIENEWSVVVGLTIALVGVGLGLVLMNHMIAKWIPVGLGFVLGVAATLEIEHAQSHWVEIQRRSHYWRVTKGKGKKRESEDRFDMDQVNNAEVEEDEKGMWLMVFVRDRSAIKLIGRSFKWTWVELEAMREELLCPRVSDLC